MKSTAPGDDARDLRNLPLFANLPPEAIGWLSEVGSRVAMEAGPIYRQGEPATSLFVLLRGEVVRSKTRGNDEVEIDRQSQPGAYGGAVHAFVDAPEAGAYMDSMRSLGASQLFVLRAGDFATLMHRWCPAGVLLLTDQFAETAHRIGGISHRDHMAALGSLAAGLAHELNNPASAGVRAATLLRNRLWRTQEKLAALAAGDYTPEELGRLLDLQETAVQRSATARRSSPMEVADAHDELVSWLANEGIDDGWDLAPTFVQANLSRDFFDEVLQHVGTPLLEDAIRWLNHSVETELLIREIEESSRRISTLVDGARQYARLDRHPSREVDIHETLDSTLALFADRLTSVLVVKNYDTQAAVVPAFAAEIEQAWANLIDNALGAMHYAGTLTITTSVDDLAVVVAITDSGTGIPGELRSRVFEPFFTTKPFGEGTGLGLDVVSRVVRDRHHGTIDLASEPGRTSFTVRLPVVATDQHS